MSVQTPITCDVLVIGGGVVGCAVLRELSGANLRLVMVEAEGDVGQGISRANTAIAHTGFDAPPGSLEARLVTHSHHGFATMCARLGVATRPCGALMVALSAEDLPRLEAYRQMAGLNGITVEPIGRAELFARWPYLNRSAEGGLLIPGEMSIDSFGLTLAYAEAAVRNGATILLDQPVVSIDQTPEALTVKTRDYCIQASFVVNAAGLQAAKIAHMVGDHTFDIRPRKGQLLVVEPADSLPIETILLPTPSPTTKGILITPAAHGNLLLGPTAEDGADLDDWQTTSAGLEHVRQGVQRLVPALVVEYPLTQYAGIRSVGYQHTESGFIPANDYIVRPASTCPHLIHVAGIRSTGLSASPALAVYVAELLASQGLGLAFSHQLSAVSSGRPDPIAERADVIQRDDQQILCACSGVTAGQVRAAIHGAVPAQTLDALKRRLWCMAGPCQGSLCIAPLVQILAAETGAAVTTIRKHAFGSEVLVGIPPAVPIPEPRFYTSEPPALAQRYQVVVIGAGPAGLAAAQAAHNAGARVLLVDRADQPGGALAAMSLLDPWTPATDAQLFNRAEQASDWQVGTWLDTEIDYVYRTSLTRIEGDALILRGPQGQQRVEVGVLVLATGGRETTRGNLVIPGSRPAGVLTAGAVLRLINATRRLPGTQAVICGTGQWASQVARSLAVAGVAVSAITPSVMQIEGWPRISHVLLADRQRVACDLLVLAGSVQPWEALSMQGAAIQIFFAGSMALGDCSAEQAAAHGSSVGNQAAKTILI